MSIISLNNLIFTIRGEKVILDAELARLYGVPVKRLNEQVKRNADRFPEDFVFRLTQAEVENLKSQNATSSLPGQNLISQIATSSSSPENAGKKWKHSRIGWK